MFFAGGYYTLLIANTTQKLRAIVLNTNLYSGSNKVTLNEPDPGNQFEWLENQLRNAVSNEEKVSRCILISI